MGQEKYRLSFGSETLLQRICRIVQPEVSRTLIVAAVDQQIPHSESTIQVLRDEIQDAGPLAGISQALTYLQTIDDPPVAAFVTSCDVPLLKPELISLLRNQLTEEFDAIAVRDSDYAYPLCAIYRTKVAATAARLIASGQRRAATFPEHLRTRWLSRDEMRTVDPELLSLMNCNTPADFENVLRHSGTIRQRDGQ